MMAYYLITVNMEVIKKSQKIINKAAEIINDGGVVICPTDTVYGFLADAGNKNAVDKIFEIKKREKTKPLPVFVKDIKMAKELAEIDEDQEKILNKKWPGKFTFVLKRKAGFELYGVNEETIAIRIPKHKFLNDLLEKINKPLVQTSVNISGQLALIKIKEIIKQFSAQGGSASGGGNQPDLIIDGGDLKKSKSSIIIDLSEGEEKMLRY